MKAVGCIPYSITKEEYESFIKLIREGRVEKVRKSIHRLADVAGIDSTKTIIANILKDF